MGLAETPRTPRLARSRTPRLDQSQQRHSLQQPLLAPGQRPGLGQQRAVPLPATPAKAAKPGEAPCPQPLPSPTPACWEHCCPSHFPDGQLTESPFSASRSLLAAAGRGTVSKHFRLALETLHNWPEPLPLPAQTPRSSHTGFIVIPGPGHYSALGRNGSLSLQYLLPPPVLHFTCKGVC